MFDLDLRIVLMDWVGMVNILVIDCVLVFMIDYGVRFINIVELEMDMCFFFVLFDLFIVLFWDVIWWI